MIIIEVIILSNHTVPIEVLINIENVSEKPRLNSVERLYICKIKRHEAETIKAATDNVNTDTILFDPDLFLRCCLIDRNSPTIYGYEVNSIV